MRKALIAAAVIPALAIACTRQTSQSGGSASASAGGGTSSPSAPAGFTPYADTTNGFWIAYPSGWEVHTAKGVSVGFVAPRSAGDTFSNNVNVLDQQIPSSMSLDQYSTASLANAGQIVGNFQVISQGSTTLSGLPARSMTYSGTVGGKSLQFYAEWTVVTGKAWVLTYSATPETFDRDLQAAQTSISSFKLS